MPEAEADRARLDAPDEPMERGASGGGAPDGLRDLRAGILRINPRNAQPRLFRQKAEAYRARWPWLTIADAG